MTDTLNMVQATLFDHDAAQGVLQHHLKDLSEIDQRILNAIISAYKTDRDVEDRVLNRAREIFGTFRADGRP